MNRRLLLPLLIGWATAQAEARTALDFDSTLRLQIYLDNRHFGVGPIDGRPGGFTTKATRWCNLQDGAQANDTSRLVALAVQAVPHPLASHVIKAADFRFVGPVAEGIPAQAKQQTLPYRSMLEMVAERYHASEGLLRRINPGLSLSNLRAGQSLIVPNVQDIFAIEAIDQARQFAKDSYRSACYAVVDTRERMATIFEGTKILAAFPITPGKAHLVPHGRWRIQTMGTLPSFRWDELMLREGRRGTEAYLLPPGPNNLIGIFWAGINKPGIGLHGTNSPETIGRTLSAGCVRFANWDAIRLPDFLRPGSEVIIR